MAKAYAKPAGPGKVRSKKAADAIEINARFKRWNAERDPWISVWEDIYDYTLPNRERFTAQADGNRRDSMIFDETAVVGIQEFASRLQSGVVPPWQRWLECNPGTEVPAAERMQVKSQLDIVTEYVFEELSSSNFDQEISEAFIDLAVGTCTILMEDGGIDGSLKFQTLAPASVVLGVGPFGRIDQTYRLEEIEVTHIKVRWPEAELTPDMERAVKDAAVEGAEPKKYKIISGCYREWSRLDDEVHCFHVVVQGSEDCLWSTEFTGAGSSPFISGRWSRLAGEVYGRGPAFNCLAAVKTLNLTTQLILENADMAVTGMYQAEDDGVVNVDTIELVPGTIIPIGMGSKGLTALQAGGNFNVADLIIEKMQHNVKKALYNETLGAREGTPASAQEILERMNDLARQMGAPVNRVYREIALPVFQRAAYLLNKAGKIEMPAIDGRKVKPRFTSPMAQSQANQDLMNSNRYLEMVQVRFPQSFSTVINAERTIAWLGEKAHFPVSLNNTPAETKAMKEGMAQIAQNAMQAGADPAKMAGAGQKLMGG